MVTILLIFVLGHLIADFWLQTREIVQDKQKWKVMFRHGIHHLLSYLSLSVIFGELDWTTLLSALMIAMIHVGIDYGKVKWEQRMQQFPSTKTKSWFDQQSFRFVADQLAHFLSLYLVLLVFVKSPSPAVMISLLTDTANTRTTVVSTDSQILAVIAILVALTHGSAYFIQAILSDLRTMQPALDQTAATAEQTSDPSLKEINAALESLYQNRSLDLEVENTVEKHAEDPHGNKHITKVTYSYQKFEPSQTAAGKYIGMLERLLIAILVVKSAYTGIAFIGAMKTLTRFKQFDEKGFAEYYLLGTFLSVLLGFAGGFLLSLVL